MKFKPFIASNKNLENIHNSYYYNSPFLVFLHDGRMIKVNFLLESNRRFYRFVSVRTNEIIWCSEVLAIQSEE